MLTVLENYLLRVEHFGNLIQVLLIPNSKLSVTVYMCVCVCVCIYMCVCVCVCVYIYIYGETVIYLNSQIYRQL